MFKDFEQINLALFVLLAFFLGVIFVFYLVMFCCWLVFTFIRKNNSKNQPAGLYLKAILKQEGYKFNIKIRPFTMRYFNVKYYQQLVKLNKSDNEKYNIWNIYNCLTYIQSVKWKDDRKWYVFFLRLATIFFILTLLSFSAIFITYAMYKKSTMSLELLNSIVQMLIYFSLISLISAWSLWVFYYEQMRQNLLALADDYLNPLEYQRIRVISLIKMLTLGSESLFIFTF